MSGGGVATQSPDPRTGQEVGDSGVGRKEVENPFQSALHRVGINDLKTRFLDGDLDGPRHHATYT